MHESGTNGRPGDCVVDRDRSAWRAACCRASTTAGRTASIFLPDPSQDHWLGTDAVGRDRLARLLHGTRVSLSLAPAAAALSYCLAFVVGGCAGLCRWNRERVAKTIIDLVLSIPWLFLLLMVRAMLPLNTSPAASATITFLMLGLLGWGVPATNSAGASTAAAAVGVRAAGPCLRALRGWRLLCVHVMPNLLPVLVAQFWIAVPVFILAEANLSLLGLGVAEPLPSLGSLLRELETVLSIRSDMCSFAALFAAGADGQQPANRICETRGVLICVA